MAKESKQKDLLKVETEKRIYFFRRKGVDCVVKERATKSNELIGRLQELNDALTTELDVVKTKERNMILEEKRLR